MIDKLFNFLFVKEEKRQAEFKIYENENTDILNLFDNIEGLNTIERKKANKKIYVKM